MSATDFAIHILGSGAAIPTHSRQCSAQVVALRGMRILIDCGEGTQTLVRRSHLKLQSISVVLISHLHGDHFFGLPGLLSTMHLCGRTTPLTIIGPKGIADAIQHFCDASYCHIDYPIEYIEVDNEKPQQIYSNKVCQITTFPLQHSVPTYGFIIEEIPRGVRGPRRYAYCCDTAPFDQLPTWLADVDMLCMESTFANDHTATAKQLKHSTAQQAANIALQAHARHLLLTHFSARYEDPQTFLDEAQAIFPNTQCAEDGKTIYLDFDAKEVDCQM